MTTNAHHDQARPEPADEAPEQSSERTDADAGAGEPTEDQDFSIPYGQISKASDRKQVAKKNVLRYVRHVR